MGAYNKELQEDFHKITISKKNEHRVDVNETSQPERLSDSQEKACEFKCYATLERFSSCCMRSALNAIQLKTSKHVTLQISSCCEFTYMV
jgi:hypothetical protein